MTGEMKIGNIYTSNSYAAIKCITFSKIYPGE